MDDAQPVRVRVAYGTSRGVAVLASTDFAISQDNPAAYALSGLSRPTRFCMTNVVILDYTEFWFDRAPGVPLKPTPQMGVLHPSLMGAVKTALEAAGLL